MLIPTSRMKNQHEKIRNKKITLNATIDRSETIARGEFQPVPGPTQPWESVKSALESGYNIKKSPKTWSVATPMEKQDFLTEWLDGRIRTNDVGSVK